MVYALQNINKESKFYHKFLSIPGHEHSYTNDVRYVHFFNTKEFAETCRCVESEIVVEFG